MQDFVFKFPEFLLFFSVHYEEENDQLEECCADLQKYINISYHEGLAYTPDDLHAILHRCSLLTSEILTEALTEAVHCICPDNSQEENNTALTEMEVIDTFADLLTKQIFIDLDMKTRSQRGWESRTRSESTSVENTDDSQSEKMRHKQYSDKPVSERTGKSSQDSTTLDFESPVTANTGESTPAETEIATPKVKKSSTGKAIVKTERKSSTGSNSEVNAKRKHSFSPERKVSSESFGKKSSVTKSSSAPERKVSGVNNGDPVTKNSMYQCHCCKIVCNNSTFYKRCTCDKGQARKYGSLPKGTGAAADNDNNDRTDSDEDRDEFGTFKGKRDREEKAGFGSSLRLNMLKKVGCCQGKC